MNRAHRLRTLLMPAAVIVVLTSSLCVFSSELCAADTPKEIRIGGTGTDLAVMKLLGQAFQKEYPEIAITVYPSLGSSGGIKALLGGDLDIAVTSQNLTAPDLGQGLVAFRYGRTPFVFITHKTNKLSDITLQEVIDIYNGKTTAWPDDTPVRLILRPARESSTEILKGISEDMHRAVEHSFTRQGLNVAINDQENAGLIEKLPGSFGAASLCQLISEKRSLKILSFNGVKPGLKTLADGTYPYFKDLYIVTPLTPSPLVRQFIDFVFSSSGQTILARTGHLTFKKLK